MTERQFFESKIEPTIVSVPAGEGWWRRLEMAGIDTFSPFLIYKDRAADAIMARQLPEWREGHPARLFDPTPAPLAGSAAIEPAAILGGVGDGVNAVAMEPALARRLA